MVKVSEQTAFYLVRELIYEMLQQLRAGDGTDLTLNRSVLLAQERVTRNGVQPLVAKLDDVRADISTSLVSFRETANRIHGQVDGMDARLARLEEEAAKQTGGLRRIAEACAVTLGVLRHYVLFHFARQLSTQDRAEGRTPQDFSKLEGGYLRWVERLRQRGAAGDVLGEVGFKEIVAQTAEAMREVTAMNAPQAPTAAPPAAVAGTPPAASPVAPDGQPPPAPATGTSNRFG